MGIKSIPNINILWASLIVEELIRNGVRDFFIAPGSRSAPLTIAAAMNKKAETHIHFDERGLGFYALGKISVIKNPAVLISTSGTAVANFLPAVIETSKKKLPLLVLTSDRPPELLKTGALQAIEQEGIFGKYVRWNFSMPTPDINIKPEMVLTTVDQAVFKAKNPEPGPVHINTMFREPLSPEKSEFDFTDYIKNIEKWASGERPFTKYFADKSLPEFDKTEILNLLNKKKGIIVVGKLNSEEQEKAVLKLAKKLNWPVFPDLTSNLRLRKDNENLIHYFDRILAGKDFDSYKIETILHLGGRISSKNYYKYIERIKPENYITVLNHYLRNDPLHIVSHRIKSEISVFINAIVEKIIPDTDNSALKFLNESSKRIDEFLNKQIAECSKPVDEISIARIVSKEAPENTGIFLSNSMPIRDMDTFAADGKRLVIGANRGASGIDGIIATSCGFSEGLNNTVTAIIGDLAFLHDLNSLAIVSKLKNKIVFIIINNGGGGIFSFLPIREYSEVFEEYFETPHNFSFKETAKMFGLDYFKPDLNVDFIEKYREALNGNSSAIIEIKTDRKENYKLHKEIEEKIKKITGEIDV